MGETSVDESLLTGESLPRMKTAGDELVAGSINLDGKIRMRVETTGSDTTLGTISRLSERARYARPAFVQLADRIASYIVVALLVIAAGVAAAWYLIDPERAFVITLSVLVVTCPCALALATPAAFAAAGTRLAQMRLLVTNGNAVEALARATHVLFDKTGTVTRGQPAITAVEVLDPEYDEARCRNIAAALETVSTHPLAKAFSVDANPVVATDQRVVIGEGVSATIDGRRWRLGKAAFAGATDDIPGIVLGVDGHVVARFIVEDELRDQSEAIMIKLAELGLRRTLISGDRKATVRKIASRLDMDDYHANCSPEDKLDIIRSAQEAGDTVIMVGDGINDAPVLAGADASIAPSHGAALAQTSADIILIGEILTPIAAGIGTARNTMRIVRQNLAWAIVYNACALPLAALGYVPPWAAAIGMSASSLIVVLNSLRISKMS
jgi:Cu2+-exporting ATPase